jgi:phosphatidylserine/phosphatidylglycerophosphate/cardiolipin synthase-like enzyme
MSSLIRYVALESRLRRLAAARGSPNTTPLRVLHYSRAGWTFHSKGVWLWPPLNAPPSTTPITTPKTTLGAPPPSTPPSTTLSAPSTASRPTQSTDPPSTQPTAAPRPANSSGVRPIATLIGSSNLSERSTRRDVELSFFVLSTDEGVRAQLDDEQHRLCVHAREADARYDAHDDGEAQAWGHARIQRASLMQSLMARLGSVAMRSFF